MAQQPPKVVIALAGGVRPSSMAAALGHPLVDLPLPDGRTIHEAWRDEVQGLARTCGEGTIIPLRTMVSKPSPLPKTIEQATLTPVTVEYDRVEYRGTGGLLRDLASDLRADDRMLVVHGNQVPLTPLVEVYSLLCSRPGEVVLLAEPDGTASGVYLIRAGVLQGIRDKGYIDFKEQALPEIAGRHEVSVARGARPVLRSLRTLDQYISTVRLLELRKRSNGHMPEPSPHAEEWTRTFSMVDASASVAKDAIVHDSVVLANAKIPSGAVVVRSIVGRGSSLARGERLFDSVYGTGGRSRYV